MNSVIILNFDNNMFGVYWIVYQIYNVYDFKRLKICFNYDEFILDNEE